MTIHTYRPIRNAVIAIMTWIFLLQVTASSVGAYALGSVRGHEANNCPVRRYLLPKTHTFRYLDARLNQ